MISVLVGHRGVGKSKLGALAAATLKIPFFDVDEVITERTGRTPETILDDSVEEFRALEIRTLEELCERGEAVITPGAGIGRIPSAAFVIWIEREGWSDIAFHHRKRLRPELTFEEEVAWMKESREPRYAEVADAKLEIPDGESLEDSAGRLVQLIERLRSAEKTPLMKRTWWIATPERLEREAAHAFQWGGGIEFRSDLFDFSTLKVSFPVHHTLFSIRTDRAKPPTHPDGLVDCDLEFLSSCINSQVDLYSSHPAQGGTPHFPQAAPSVKWAPTLRSFSDLPEYLRESRDLRKKFPKTTILPQGKRWVWLRTFEAIRNNQWNYLSSSPTPAGTPDLSYWALFTHATTEATPYALIGDPVEKSSGIFFHNQTFQRGKEDAFYVNVNVETSELGEALEILHELGFSGLSVTAPHKRAILSHPMVSLDPSVPHLKAANTLRRSDRGWVAYDTDEVGMLATLLDVEACRSIPRTTRESPILLIGKGGVADAVLRALKKEMGEGILHLSFRDVSPSTWEESYSMVVNASGRDLHVTGKAMPEVWIDLRYGAAASNGGGKRFVSGQRFFEAQAMDQLKFWGIEIGGAA